MSEPGGCRCWALGYVLGAVLYVAFVLIMIDIAKC